MEQSSTQVVAQGTKFSMALKCNQKSTLPKALRSEFALEVLGEVPSSGGCTQGPVPLHLTVYPPPRSPSNEIVDGWQQIIKEATKSV